MVKWYIKYLLSTLIGILPFRHKIHYLAQRVIGTHHLDEEEMLSRAIELMLLSKKFKTNIANKVILEIGTGWYPYVPVMSYLLGAKKVVTVDINPWVNIEGLEKTISSIVNNSKHICDALGIENDEFRNRLKKLNNILEVGINSLDILDEINVLYMPGVDVNDLRVNEDDKFDIVLSANVLEHIEPDVLKNIYQHMRNITRADGILVHRFNPADHFANLSGSTITFLTVSDFVWNMFLGGRGLSYHNRLRASEHAALQCSNGWSILFWANAVDDKAKSEIQSNRMKLSERYLKMNPDDICTFYCWLVASMDSTNDSVSPVSVKWVNELL